MNPSYDNFAGGDIILSPSTNTKKSKKWLIILGILVVILIIVGLVVWSTQNNRNNQETSQTEEFENSLEDMSTTELFDGYYNMLVFGTDEVEEGEDVGELPDTWFFEYVVFGGVSNEEDAEWLNKTKKYYEAFSTKYQGDINVNYSQLLSLYLEIANRDKVIEEANKIKEQSGEEAVNEYVDNLIKVDSYPGIYKTLASNTAYYFKGSEDADLISPVLDLVQLIINNFKDQTIEIGENLESDDVQE